MKRNNHWMTEKEYKLVTSLTPIPTVDLVIFKKGTIPEVLLLIRKTGYEKGKWCIIGGRQQIRETLEDAINRHSSDLGVKVNIIPPFHSQFPAWIHDDPNQDKTKHSCTHIYPALISKGKIKEEGEEYNGYKWFKINKLPKNIAYHHKKEILITMKQLKKFRIDTPPLHKLHYEQ